MTDAPKKIRNTPRSEARQRAARVTVRFLPDEHAELEARASAAGLSPSAYLRACALGDAGPRARRSPTVERSLAAQAIAELNKAGSNLNQIARAVNMEQWPGSSSMIEATEAVKRAATMILQAFGYKTHDSQGKPPQ
jgi:hypothetical protein